MKSKSVAGKRNRVIGRKTESRSSLVRIDEQSRLLDTILSTLQDAVVAVDKDGRYLIFNAAAERILGVPRESIELAPYGKYFSYYREDELTPVPREELPLARALSGEVIHRVPLFVKAPGSARGIHISVSGGPVRCKNSGVLAAVVSFVDMTEIRETLSKLTEQQQMLTHASRMTAVGELAGAIAHEINTPLATLSLIFDILKDQIAELPVAVPAKVTDHLDMVGKLNERIGTIVSSLRSVCRTGNGDPFTTAPISRILNDTEVLCVERLKILGISFSVKNELEMEMGIECRPVQVVQVLLNLVNNACDAIKGFDTKWLDVEIKQDGDFIELTVTNSGPRIPEKVASKLFSPLFSTKPDGQGTGIGLNISKRIVESHNGAIFYNRDHEHTQFVVRLPILQRARSSTAA